MIEMPEALIDNDEGIFLASINSYSEPSDLIISQDNTLHAVAPLFMPKIQVLGTQLSPQADKDIISYRVERGDSLGSLAEQFGISVNTIIWANNLKGTRLAPNQELVILPTSGVLHIVRKGDTLASISKKYQADEGEVIDFNNLSSDQDIQIGDILIVAGGEISRPIAPTPTPVSRPSLASSGMIVPTAGYISQGLHIYNAIDIANRCGTPIYSAAAGIVQLTGYHHIGGNYIRILHPSGVVTYYGHLSSILVSRGQSVSQGSLIGHIGNTGFVIGPTGCHLHFEVRGESNPLANYRVGHRF